MRTTQEIVDDINKADISSPHFIDDEVDIDGATEVTTMDNDEHRWYHLGTIVYKHGEDFFGVYGAISLKSESMGYDDVGARCEAFIMEQVPSVTYKKKI